MFLPFCYKAMNRLFRDEQHPISVCIWADFSLFSFVILSFVYILRVQKSI